MSAELLVRSDVPPVSWEDFISDNPSNPHPPGSIALDGYVTGPPQLDHRGPYYNANHHEGVDRLATLATAQQISMAMRMGLVDRFTRDGEFSPYVFVNDCDQDVCAAWYLLEHPEEAMDPTPAMNRFTNVGGVLDVTAGTFPYKSNMALLPQIAWVFGPYTDFRASGEMADKNNAQYEAVIRTVCGRIALHLAGEGGETPLDTRYQIIGGGKGWSMIHEQGQQGKFGAIGDGVKAYVSVQTLPDDRWRYSLGRLSRFVPFEIPEILRVLNEAEGNKDDLWGGADTIAGSPRVGASKLSPEQVENIINDYLEVSQHGVRLG